MLFRDFLRRLNTVIAIDPGKPRYAVMLRADEIESLKASIHALRNRADAKSRDGHIALLNQRIQELETDNERLKALVLNLKSGGGEEMNHWYEKISEARKQREVRCHV